MRTHRRPFSAPDGAAAVPFLIAAAILVGSFGTLLEPGSAHAQAVRGREFRPEASLSTDPDLEALLDRLDAAQRALTTFRADFRQAKEDDLFAEGTEQVGRFSFRQPADFRWDYIDPDPMVVIAAGDHVRRWLPTDNVVKEMDVSRHRRRILAHFGIGSDVSSMRRHFDIRLDGDDATVAGADRIELRGKRRRVQKRLRLVEMWVDRRLSLPVKVRVALADGGSTTWEFSRLEVDPPLADDLFVLAVPDGARVVPDDDEALPPGLLDALLEDEEGDEAPGGHGPGAPAGADSTPSSRR